MLRVAGLLAVVGVGVALIGAGDARTSEAPAIQEGTQSVLFVANNWDGTADIVDPESLAKLGRLNVVPDLEERLAEIYTDPERLGYFLGIRMLVGEGNDQFADDMFSSHDGRVVFVSRPSLADAVAIDLKTNEIVWRFPMEGQRADHMAVSHDGTRLLVSDNTVNKVQVLDTADGRKVGEFPSGDTPHENNYSRDGSRIFHASIGLVYTPTDQPQMDSTKGERYFQIVDARTNQVIKRLDVGQILADHGHEGYSSAVRPMAISPDEKTAYFQLSFLHGFVEFDLVNDRPLRIANLPVSEEAQRTSREQYILDSAHHGLAINPEGTKLCAAATMSDYAAIVSTDTFDFTRLEVGPKPYWSTNSGDGRRCFVSVSEADQVVAIDYETEKEVGRIQVGDHPQRMRMGVIRSEYLGELRRKATRPPRRAARLQLLGTRLRGRTLRMRLRIDSAARGKLRVRYGTHASFGVDVPERARGGSVTWRVSRRLPPRPPRRAMVDVRHAGDARVAPDGVRLRNGGRGARLRIRRARMDERGRMTLTGTIARRARGPVHARLAYQTGDGRVDTLNYRTRVRRGRWILRALLPARVARSGGHLSVEYRGHRRRGIRGEQRTTRLVRR